MSEKEIKGALALMESMSRNDLEGHDFKDTYTEATEQIIEAKREEKARPDAPEPEKPGRVLDLMAALEETVSTAKAPRGEDSDVHELPKKKAAAKKTTAKKAAGQEDRGEEDEREEATPQRLTSALQIAEPAVRPAVGAGGDALGEPAHPSCPTTWHTVSTPADISPPTPGSTGRREDPVTCLCQGLSASARRANAAPRSAGSLAVSPNVHPSRSCHTSAPSTLAFIHPAQHGPRRQPSDKTPAFVTTTVLPLTVSALQWPSAPTVTGRTRGARCR
ncbi:hypothetical protein NFX46_21215 [Streptomyces phaeoluteigriseus]|uniref:Ku domain-containing protein n=1 Tax=Streptomyces phaeoluteigriseus TaxID=114686 RepID=A0ABY4ZB11_9ACTN|nr:hypothetical protein [Streptomyces phaeoluteigriseus]USQ86014.1 hypothetical protein NFX46_21215 [Streptomyces phaeoluteigriseus]